MKAGWVEKRLVDFCEIYQPNTISGKQMIEDGEYPVFGANGIIGRYSKFNHEEPQLLLGCRGSCGAINVSQPKSWINGNAMVVRAKKEISSLEFMCYVLENIDFKGEGVITGTATPQITRKILSPVKVFLPPLKEQQRIVEILDESFGKLETAHSNIVANLESSKELFQSILNESLSEATWEVKPLEDLCDILDKNRKPITKKDRRQGAYPYYGATGIVDYVDDYLFDEPLVLLGEDGAKWEAGENSAFAIDGKTWVNNHAHVIRPYRNVLLDSWLIYYLNFSNLIGFVTGVTVPKLNQTKMKSIKIPLPPIEEQQHIVEKLDSLREQTNRLQQKYTSQLADMDELRQSLLQKAFAGELT